MRSRQLHIIWGLSLVTLLASVGLMGSRAQEPSSSPSGAALYAEPWRPQFHFSQPDRFMNDPNGLVYHDGEWHLFYQYRPGGGIVWGHAVSRDLLHWENLPVAIPLQEDGKSIFSGSVVVDSRNTAGFGRQGTPAMVAVYTASGRGNQSQALAYSLDRGRTFTFHSGNPVLDIGSSQFRDPKVFWHEETRRWIMVVAMPDDHQVPIYGSTNLKDWELLSNWGPLPPVGGQYEVPDLFPLDVDGDPTRRKWVMVISTNPGGLWEGSLTAAYIGDFDGTTFREDSRYAYGGPAGATSLADFEGVGHGDWTTTGTAFGSGPSAGSVADQPLVNGYLGERLVNSFHGGAAATGTLTSPPFTISRRFINFLVGGGVPGPGRGGRGRGVAAPEPDPGRAVVTLVVDGVAVRSTEGTGRNTLDWHSWDVADLAGRSARIVIVDDSTTGRILIDQVGFADTRALPGIERTPWFDWGKDNYAGITFDNAPDGRRLFVGWLNNWQYAQSNAVPTTAWWRGQQSVPRELSLRTVNGRPELFQIPLRELVTLRAGLRYQERQRQVTGVQVVPASGAQLDIEATFRPNAASKVGLKVLTGTNGDETVIGYDVSEQRLYIDRTRSGAAATGLNGFPGVHSAPLTLRNGTLNLRVLVDHSIVEVFAENGERVLTDLVYPSLDSRGLAILAEGGTATLDVDVYEMRSIWSGR